MALATPVSTHFPLGRAVLEAGKHLFVEKPLASSTAECLELIELAQRRGLVLMPGHTFLYSPPVVAIRNLIESGELGDLYFVSTSRVNLGLHQKDVSVTWDLGPHDFSILRYWLDEAPSAVSAVSRGCVIPSIPDVAFIDLEYSNGTIAHVELSWLAPSKLRRTTIVGSQKMVVYDDTSTEPVRVFDSGVDPEGAGDLRRVPAHVPDRRHRLAASRRRRAALARAPGLLRRRDVGNDPALVGDSRTRGRPDDRGSRPLA